MPRLMDLIDGHHLSWEMVPTEKLDNKEVWRALALDMPVNALIRNLATLTRVGAVTPMDADWLVQQLHTKMNTNRRVIHPLNVLSALVTYRSGKSVRGSHTWDPILRISSALDEVFYRSFGQAPQTNQRLYMGVDISGSMSYKDVAGVPGLTPRMAASAMAMAIVHREPNYYIAGFSTTAERSSNQGNSNVMTPLDITATDNLHDAMAKTQALPFGGTDCSLPMLDALEKKMPVDCFIILTTAELSLHPYHEAKAGGVATPNNPRHSAHGPGSEEGRDEPQTAGKTTAGQRARPVHQVPPRTCRAKQDPLRAVPQKDPRIRSQERSRSQTGQVYQGVSLSYDHRAKKARRKLGLLFAVSLTVRRATIDYGPAGDKMTASIRWQPVSVQLYYNLGRLWHIFIFIRVCYMGLTGTTSEALTLPHFLYQSECESSGSVYICSQCSKLPRG